MAVLAISAVGSAIGASIGGSFLGVAAASWGYMAGSLVGNALFANGKNTQGPRLNDLKVTGTDYGAPIAWVAGSPRVAGQIVWASNKREIASTQSAGKGSGPSVTSYTYEVDILVMLSENSTQGIARVWSNGDLVYDGAVTRDGIWQDIVVYTGAADQLPDPTYEAAVGAGNAPAYRGRTTVLIRGLQLGNSGQLPNLTFEVGATILTGNNVNDYSTHRWPTDATPDGSPASDGFAGTVTSPAKFGAAGRFTGTYITPKRGVTIGSSPTFISMGTKLWTVACWLYSPHSNYADARGIVFANGLTGGVTDGVRISFNEFGQLAVGIRGSAGYLNLPTTSSAAACNLFNQWFHLAVTKTSSHIYGYVNGVQVLSVLLPTSGGSVLPVNHADPWEIGGGNASGPNWNGYIDDFVYDESVLWSGAFTPPTTRHQLTPTTQIYIPFEQNNVRGSEPLHQVVDKLMLRAGYLPAEYDVTDLVDVTRPVRALAVAQVASTRATLEALMSAFFFYAVKAGEVIVFRRRQTAVAATISRDHLGAAADAGSSATLFAPKFGNDMELPAQVALSYPNMLADYNTATEYSDRLLGSQESTQTVQMGIGMEPAEAKLVADALLMDQVNAAVTATITLPALRYAALECGDVLQVPDRTGLLYRMRITSRTDAAAVATFELAQDDPAALQSAAVTSTDYALTETVRQLAPTWWEAMDIPLLRDADDAPGYYVAVGPNRAAADDIWRGAVFVRAWTPEAWETVAEIDTAATLGATTSALPAWNGRNVFDESTVLTVRVSGELASSTRDAMLTDLSINTLLVGSEVLRFRQATLTGSTDGESDYTLTGLLRAQLGTEWAAAATVAAGARVVLLDGATLRRVTDQTSQIGVPSDVKAVTSGMLLSSATAEAFANTAVCLKPLAPVHGRAAHAGADVALTWQRRTRLSTRVGGAVGTSVPLGEQAEAYRVRIYSGATLLRTADTTSPAYTYTAADQATDGLSSAATFTATVVQISATVGEGYAATINGTTP